MKIKLLVLSLALPFSINASADYKVLSKPKMMSLKGEWQYLETQYGEWVEVGALFDCSGIWSPPVNTVASGQVFTQSQSCSQNEERTVADIETFDLNSNERTIQKENETRVVSKSKTQQAVGTLNLYPEIVNFSTYGSGANIAQQSEIVSSNTFKLSYENVGRGENSDTGNARVYFNERTEISRINISGNCDYRSSSGSNSGSEMHTLTASNAVFTQKHINRSSNYGSDYTTRSFKYNGVEQTKYGVYPLTSLDKKNDSLNRFFDFSDKPLIINAGSYLLIEVYNKYYTHSTGYGYGCHKTLSFTFNELN